MSLLYASQYGWLISHQNYIKNIYKNVIKENEVINLQLKDVLFNINCPYVRNDCKTTKHSKDNLKKKRKKHTSNSNFEELKSEVEYVSNIYQNFLQELRLEKFFNECSQINDNYDNKLAQAEAEHFYNELEKYSLINSYGSNNGEEAIIRKINEGQFLFPKNCRFFSKNVTEIEQKFENEKFDLILLDPPWWNKYIRRKNARSNQGYQMMYSVDLNVIPVDKILTTNGLVVLWCTNSPQHLRVLQNEIFPKWGLQTIAKWYWLKVTCKGEPICSFSEPPGKQPFEQIIFGVRLQNKIKRYVPNKKLVVSIPSALHSHKPPLADLLSQYIEQNARCLEIFARYLLPGWTSWGFEVIKLQQDILYEPQD